MGGFFGAVSDRDVALDVCYGAPVLPGAMFLLGYLPESFEVEPCR